MATTLLSITETFSSDTAALTYASSSQYTLSTLANAPVGTFITYTYTASSNTRVQTSTAPTQTTADMNSNGILLYNRLYASASTAAQPSCIAIQIGKGLKGCQLGLYKSSGKNTAGNLDVSILSSNTVQFGAPFKDYNEVTGVLLIDVGYCLGTGITTNALYFSDLTTQTNGYFVINASKSPALAGIPMPAPVAANYSTNAGQAITSTASTIKYEDILFDTHNAYNVSTGVYTVPETGYYQVNASWMTAAVTQSTSNASEIYLRKNGTNIAFGRCNGTGNSNDYQQFINQVFYFVKGDQVDIQGYSAVSTTVIVTSGYNIFSISKLRGL